MILIRNKIKIFKLILIKIIKRMRKNQVYNKIVYVKIIFLITIYKYYQMLKIMKIKILAIRFSIKLIIIKFKTVKHYLLKAIQKKKIKTLIS